MCKRARVFKKAAAARAKEIPPHLLCPGPPHMATLDLGHTPAHHGILRHGLVVGMREAAKGFPLLPTHRAPRFLEKGK